MLTDMLPRLRLVATLCAPWFCSDSSKLEMQPYLHDWRLVNLVLDYLQLAH